MRGSFCAVPVCPCLAQGCFFCAAQRGKRPRRLTSAWLPEAPAADFTHGPGFDRGFFSQAGALAAAHDDFHGISRCRMLAVPVSVSEPSGEKKTRRKGLAQPDCRHRLRLHGGLCKASNADISCRASSRPALTSAGSAPCSIPPWRTATAMNMIYAACCERLAVGWATRTESRDMRTRRIPAGQCLL